MQRKVTEAGTAYAVSLSRALARRVLVWSRDGVSEAIRRKARLHIRDSEAIALAARAEPIGAQVIAAAGAGHATGDCRIFGEPGSQGDGMPPGAAAFVNSALIHVLDFDDIHDAARLHPTTVTLPAAMAARDITRDEKAAMPLEVAVAVANEVMCRFGLLTRPSGTGPTSGWFLTQLYGYLGATVAAGLVLGLDEAQHVSALGLAMQQAAGAKQAGFGVGATARSIYPAYAAQDGVRSVLLARAGLVGPEDGLDGAAGMLPLYLGLQPDEAFRDALLGCDADWAFLDTDIKPWPCCRLSHPYVKAASELRASLRGSEATSVDVWVNASAGRLCVPFEARRRPPTLQDAKYSIPFMVAFALIHGAPTLATLNEDALSDRRVLDCAARVTIHEGLPDKPGHPPVRMRVTGSGGEGALDAVEIPPTERDTVEEKIAACREVFRAYSGREAPSVMA